MLLSGREGHMRLSLTWILVPKGEQTDAAVELDLQLPRLWRIAAAFLPRSLVRKIPNPADKMLDELAADGRLDLGHPPEIDPVAVALAAGFELEPDGNYKLESKPDLWLNRIKVSESGIEVQTLFSRRTLSWDLISVIYSVEQPARVVIAIDKGRRISMPRFSPLRGWDYEASVRQVSAALEAWRKRFSTTLAQHQPTTYFMSWESLDGQPIFRGDIQE